LPSPCDLVRPERAVLDSAIVEYQIRQVGIECLWLVPHTLSSEPFMKQVSNFRIREAPATIEFTSLRPSAAKARLDIMQAMKGDHLAVHLSIETARWHYNLDNVWQIAFRRQRPLRAKV
jgi:hypothetical protein